jgi:steroid delta-isomerase-like uncharacterized protein
MPAEQNKAAILRFYAEAIGKGNVDVIDELMWPDFVHHGDALFPHIEGSAAIKAGVGGVKGAFPDGHTNVDDMVAEGETVVCRLSWKGTHEGAFMGSEPTHQVMSWKGISTYRFENGKIKERWANQDVLPMLQQMGLIHAIGLS